MTTIIVKERFTPLQLIHRLLKAAEDKGRKAGKPAGSHIGDLVDLRKSIVLCPSCTSGFNAKKARYYRQREYAYVQGNCDNCRLFQNCSFFIPDEHVKNVWAVRENENAKKGLIRLTRR